MDRRSETRLSEVDGTPPGSRSVVPSSGFTQELRYRAVFESAVDFAIIVTDLEGRVTDWNSGAVSILGWSAEDMQGVPIDRIFTPEDLAEGCPGTERRRALETGWANKEQWHLRRDGSRFWASGEITPLRGQDDAHIGFLEIIRDRTEQRRAAEAQRADAEFLRSVLASSGDCIKVLDLDAKLLFMSEGGRRVMEVGDFNAIRGCPWLDFWQGEKNEQARAAVEAAKAGGVGHFQGAANTMAGTPRYWDVQVTPILGADGRPERLLSVSRDITATRRAEEALREAEALNSSILNSSRDCIVLLDLDGHTQWVSPGGIEAMEVADVDAILGLSWLRVWKDADHEAARTAVAEARAGRLGRFQGFCATHKGTPKWWDVVISPIPGLDGEPERLVSSGRDITKRKEAENRLSELNQTLDARVTERTRERDRLWELSEDLLIAADYDGHLLRVSPSWTRLLGHDEQALLTRPYAEIIHPDDIQAVMDALLAMRSNGQPVSFENRMLATDGAWRWIAWTLSPEPGGERLTGVGRDITTLKQRQAELETAQDALRQSQKMEAVGQLTGGLAHDFNNLLAGISGSLELLQARVAQGRIGDLDRYLAAAQGASKRAAALTHRLLAFTRRQTLDPKPTDVNRLVAGMEELIRRTVGPQVVVEIVGAGGLWATLVDTNQLENALLNLCINARDAMPDGGRLTIETANRWLDDRTARQRDLPAGQYVALCVSDTGMGMTPEVVRRAFDPFFTTKPIGMGTGLGLSMIYGFVQQSGGQARIYSEAGQGAMVCLYLPRYHGEAACEEANAELAGAPRAGQGETVLVVDDEPTVRMLVTEVLEDLGYTAIEAADGPAGLKVLRSDARIDLLVTDVGLPGGMNGRQVADAGRAVRPGLKVLFITGYAENAVVGNGHLDPGMHVLTKPFAMEALASRIKELIAGR